MTADSTVTVEVTYVDRDILRGNLFILNRKPAIWVVKCLPALVIAGMGIRLYQIAHEDWHWWVVPALAGLAVFFYCFAYFFGNWNVKRIIRGQLKGNPSARGVQRYSISEDGIRMTGGLHNLDLKWEAIINAVESRHDFFLYFSKNSAYLLPKTAFADEQHQDELRSLLRIKLGERARLKLV